MIIMVITCHYYIEYMGYPFQASRCQLRLSRSGERFTISSVPPAVTQ